MGSRMHGPDHQALIESLAGAVYSCDATGHIDYYNQAAVALWGREPLAGVDRWCASHRSFATDGTPVSIEHCPMAQCLREGRAVRGRQIVVERPDGTRLTVLPHPQPLFDESGRLIGAVNLLIPMDVQHSPGGAAIEPLPLAQATLDALIARVAVLDELGVIVSVNSAWRSFEQQTISPGAALLEGCDLLHASENAALQGGPGAVLFCDGLRAVLSGTQARYDGELALNLTLTSSWYMTRISRLVWQGSPRFVVTVFDVTERKRAEQAMRDSQQRWQFAVEGSGDGLWDTDLLSGRTMYSARWRAMLGLDEQVIGDGADEWVSRIHASDWDPVLTQYQACLDATLPQFSCEARLRCHDGRWMWVLARGLVVARADDGSPLRMICTISDIDERKDAEATRDTLEAKLLMSQKMEAVGVLASSIAHDFNNIVGAILGNSEVVRQDLGPDHPGLPGLEQLRRAGLRARSLVQKLVSFGRHQPPAMSLQPIGEVFNESVDLLRATLPSNVSLQVCCSELPLAGHLDATQISQLLINLGTNAWHALQGAPGTIEIGLRPLQVGAFNPRPGLQAGAHLHLWVRDDCCGMDETVRSRIFEPFFTTKPVGTGTGLGLAVVANVVRAHGGHLEVDSAVGKGSTINVYLPASTWTPTPREQTMVLAVAPRGPSGAGRHVLFIDDDEMMVELVRELLERAGFRITCEQDAVLALEAVRVAVPPFDVVITDQNMPGHSGLELAREIRDMQPLLPVIIATGSASDELAGRAQRAGVAGVVGKERLFEDLVGEILKVLSAPTVARRAHAR